MKNLFYSLCLLIGFSSTAQSIDYQITAFNSSKNIFATATKTISSLLFTLNEEIVEEEDVAFDFDIKKYLPTNFNAFEGLFDAFDLASEEEDEPFDFDSNSYLPIGFNANIIIDDEAIAIAEEDEAFDFDTTEYLPIGFNANLNIYDNIDEIAIEEEDEVFDFDTMAYLPIGFNPYETRLTLSTTYYLNCITFPSI